MLLKIILSLQTEAAVSSHEDSIARMVIIVCKGMASKNIGEFKRISANKMKHDSILQQTNK
jgi:hypothetical protein